MSAESEDYWNAILSVCFDNASLWNMFSLSNSITISTNSSNSMQAYAVDTNILKLKQQIQNIIGVTPYTGNIVATAYKGSIILHVYENLTYSAMLDRAITLSQAMTYAGIITVIFSLFIPSHYPLTASLITFLGIGFGVGSLIPSGTTIKTYYAYATWDRYVKRRDSSVWLTEATQHTISYLALANPNTEFCEIDEGSQYISYAPSQTYYEDTATLLEKGYAYYLTL